VPSLKERKARIRLAKENVAPCQVLEPGKRYHFTIRDVSQAYDSQREYHYVFVKMACGGGIVTSDRFPITDEMLWKLKALLASVGLNEDDWTDEKQLIGLSGEFLTEKKGKWVVYRYQLL
jgi:hypothetical protein